MTKVFGSTVDNETRCIHYHQPEDVIAIKFNCCSKYYPCYKCHQENEAHSIIPWPKDDWDKQAILCGSCKMELTINDYMAAVQCPHCAAPFNPRCSNHYHLYFDMTGEGL
ncbi:CHY zinc finger protein [Macrococcus equipercicus]|uniref:CHY-type domain-containing protein n=1 Tax=Macrococcus equipercicus TaxID=69967 RepID=A0A9Q9F3L2_9STAP|nr:CHY zinc finger protein [Macrococcus equipercicus]UTH14234.1 hypothetical protein KFV11_02410 [Macrococcus equipercicus]